MSTGNLNLDLFLSELVESISVDNSYAKDAIRKRYPALDDKQAGEICAMISASREATSNDTVSLVVTTPPSFAIRAKSTKNTVESLIKGANKSILITGYSLSDYFNDLIDTIIQKSQSGVFVEFFINSIETQKNVEKLRRYRGRFLRIYNYTHENDSMSALHAKVISVDNDKTLITSANLSYHGQEGNIELGTLVSSAKVAKQVKDIFTKLVFAKEFIEIN